MNIYPKEIIVQAARRMGRSTMIKEHLFKQLWMAKTYPERPWKKYLYKFKEEIK